MSFLLIYATGLVLWNLAALLVEEPKRGQIRTVSILWPVITLPAAGWGLVLLVEWLYGKITNR